MLERTDAYRFTVTSTDDPALAELRRSVSVLNRVAGRRRLRVTVKARLGKGNPNATLVNAARGRRVAGPQDVPLRFGSRFDVYVHESW